MALYNYISWTSTYSHRWGQLWKKRYPSYRKDPVPIVWPPLPSTCQITYTEGMRLKRNIGRRQWQLDDIIIKMRVKTVSAKYSLQSPRWVVHHSSHDRHGSIHSRTAPRPSKLERRSSRCSKSKLKWDWPRYDLHSSNWLVSSKLCWCLLMTDEWWLIIRDETWIKIIILLILYCLYITWHHKMSRMYVWTLLAAMTSLQLLIKYLLRIVYSKFRCWSSTNHSMSGLVGWVLTSCWFVGGTHWI